MISTNGSCHPDLFVIYHDVDSGGSGYPIPGIPEPDRNYFVIPEPDRNLSDQDRNRVGTGLWTGGYLECQKGIIFTQNMATFEKKSTFNLSKYPLEIFLKFSCPKNEIILKNLIVKME